MSDEVLARRVQVLSALERLGDGLKAWYVPTDVLARETGVTRGKLRNDLVELERCGLAESNFQRPKSYRIRRLGEDLLAQLDDVVATYSFYQQLVENLIVGYVEGVMGVER